MGGGGIRGNYKVGLLEVFCGCVESFLFCGGDLLIIRSLVGGV